MPADGGDGVLVAAGGIVGGYTLYVKDRKPVYEYNCFTADRYKMTGASPLPVGPCTIRMEFEYALRAHEPSWGRGRVHGASWQKP